MIEVRPIPVELDAHDLADAAGVGLPEAAGFLENARPLIAPVGVFDEVRPDLILPVDLAALDWGTTIMVGLCVFSQNQESPDGDKELWPVFLQLAAGQALEFLEYRIRLYLKPEHRQPSQRLIPGCPAVPLSVNTSIIEHFQPDHTYGLRPLPDGRLGGRTGTTFLYPTSDLVFRSKCDACTLKHCPSREGLQS